VSKKIKKLIKSRKSEKKLKKQNCEKKSIRIFKKLTGSVPFYKHETEKTKPNPNRKNRAKPV